MAVEFFIPKSSSSSQRWWMQLRSEVHPYQTGNISLWSYFNIVMKKQERAFTKLSKIPLLLYWWRPQAETRWSINEVLLYDKGWGSFDFWVFFPFSLHLGERKPRCMARNLHPVSTRIIIWHHQETTVSKVKRQQMSPPANTHCNTLHNFQLWSCLQVYSQLHLKTRSVQHCGKWCREGVLKVTPTHTLFFWSDSDLCWPVMFHRAIQCTGVRVWK